MFSLACEWLSSNMYALSNGIPVHESELLSATSDVYVSKGCGILCYLPLRGASVGTEWGEPK